MTAPLDRAVTEPSAEERGKAEELVNDFNDDAGETVDRIADALHAHAEAAVRAERKRFRPWLRHSYECSEQECICGLARVCRGEAP